MKKLLTILIAVTALACTGQKYDHSFSENIAKKFTVNPNSTLALYNLLGDVTVEGYEGNNIQIEIKKTIYAETQALVEEGKRDFKLNFEDKADSLIVFISEPFNTLPNIRHVNHRRIDYNVKLDFIVRIPQGMNLRASTVNEGEMIVKNVSGKLHVNNVNGGIAIQNAQSATRAHTVNGNVEVTYLKNPAEPSSYHTINGDINVKYQGNLSADLTFKSMNGEYFTDFDNYQLMPSELEENKNKSGESTKYRVSSRSPIRIGSGGLKLKFETLNGDIYIKKS